MVKRSSLGFILFTIAVDLSLTLFSLELAGELRSALDWGRGVTGPVSALFPHSLWFFMLVGSVWTLVFTLSSVYDSRRTLRAVDELERVAWGVFLALFVLAGLLYLTVRDVPRLLFVYFGALDLTILVAWRALLRLIFRWWGRSLPRIAPRVLIVGAGRVGRRIEAMLADYWTSGVQVVGYLDDDRAKWANQERRAPVLGSLDDACRVIEERQVDEIIVALPLKAHERMVRLVFELDRLPVRIHVVPDLFNLAFAPKIDQFGGIPMIGLREPAIEGFQRHAKRVLDLVLTSVAFILALPIMVLVAVAIRSDSPGPVIFRQQRVGENGRLFWMYKFRSMCLDAEERQNEVSVRAADGTIIYKRADDPRVTRVGRFIRATSLDELPQLVNIIRGDMSIVGPRPEVPSLVEKYELWQRKRFAVPQGLTGWWQVNGRSDKPMHLHTEEDLYYIQNYSLMLDLQIIGRTLGTVIKRKGAY